MPSVAIYNSSYLNQVTRFQSSIDPSVFASITDKVIFDDTTIPNESDMQAIVASNPLRYLKVSAGAIVIMNASEQNQVDSDIAAALVASRHGSAIGFLNGPDGLNIIIRAVADITKDEINLLRQRDRDRAVDVAAATSLADLKTRWALQSTLNDRTLAQLRTAIQDRINSGQVDI